MKKIILTLLACMFLSPQAWANEKDLFAAAKVDAKEGVEQILSEADDLGRAARTAYAFVVKFMPHGDKICTEDGYFLYDDKYPLKHVIEIMSFFTKEGINVACFIKKDDGTFTDTTDNCILQRRNNKGPAHACWYNYEKFLPASSKIKTDDEFLSFVKAMVFFLGEKGDRHYCDNVPELTSKEREECREKTRKYFTQVLTKTTPHCRDVSPEEYKEFLQRNKQVLNKLTNTRKVDTYSQIEPTAMFMYDAVYGGFYDSFEKAIIEKMQEFGYKNFCTMEGFEKDMEKVQAKNSPNSSIVDLN